MGPVVHPVDRVPGNRSEPYDLHAGILHPPDQSFVHRDAADPIEQDLHAQALAGFSRERLCELLRNRTAPINIRLEGDGLSRLAKGAQHGRKDLNAVYEGIDLVAGHVVRTEKGAHRGFELVIGGSQMMR